jgi:site-specific DNA-cytosine methylase
MGKDAANVGEEADEEEQDQVESPKSPKQGKSQGKKEKGKDKEKHRKADKREGTKKRKAANKGSPGRPSGRAYPQAAAEPPGAGQDIDGRAALGQACRPPCGARPRARVFGSWYRCDDLVPCLTTGRKPIWLTSLGEGRRPQMHRLLRSAEHWGLQGFSPEDILPELSGCTAARASGKAMSVPVVGCFLEQALRFVQQGPAAPSSGSPSFSSSLSTGDGDDAI